MKGDRYMRHVSALLSQWWCGTPEGTPAADSPFRVRSTSIVPVEGHWRGKGDILHRPDIKPAFPFAVECKSVEGWTLDQLLTSDVAMVWKFWEQCRRQAQESHEWPLLLFTRKRQPDYVMTDPRLLGLFAVRKRDAGLPRAEIRASHDVTVMPWESFSELSPRLISKAWAQHRGTFEL